MNLTANIWERIPNLVKLDVFIKIPFLRKVPSHKMALNYRYLIILCPSFIIYKMGMIFVERIKRVQDFKSATMVLGTSKKAYKISDLFPFFFFSFLCTVPSFPLYPLFFFFSWLYSFQVSFPLSGSSTRQLNFKDNLKNKKGSSYSPWSRKRNAMTNLDSLLQGRDYFANKGPSSQSYGFSSSHVWM